MNERIATVIGATGLIGSYLVELLKSDIYFSTIRVIVRRPFDKQDKKIEVKLIDFTDHEAFKLSIKGSDSVFCAVGTTQKKVRGDKEAYRKVDYDIPVLAAQFCKETGCNNFLLVSSVGADSKSNNFYLQLKGKVEDAVKKQNISSTNIFHPSILLGNRSESRPGERIGQIAMQVFSFALLGGWNKYKPIHAKDVATAMLQAAKIQRQGFNVYEYSEIKALSEQV
ncbi:MAG: NAD(P)H-binding protein [Chitinophagaceae bacterium]|nr:NAD(P)H-binding protein [Chitinophagaceae bacterium]